MPAFDDPRGVVAIRRLLQASYRKMVQNLWWAAGYNLAAIPLPLAEAVEMARLVPDRTDRPELNQLAEEIIASQEAEIAQMERLASLEGAEFDLAFIDMMIAPTRARSTRRAGHRRRREPAGPPARGEHLR